MDLWQMIGRVAWILVLVHLAAVVLGSALGICIEFDLIRFGEGIDHDQAL